jgi:hypothetical protein
VSPELLQAIINGGGVAVLIWLVKDLRDEQRRTTEWLQAVVQDALVREAIARGLPPPNIPPVSANRTPPSVDKN